MEQAASGIIGYNSFRWTLQSSKSTRNAITKHSIRRWLRNASKSKNASMSIQVNLDELFHYTSGRWIYNESLRQKERYLKFDVPALRHAIATSLGWSQVDPLVKISEGGFNRIFQATSGDGKHVLVRLPYPSTVPRHYTVASEVATMEYLRLNQIPVPKVYGWSSKSTNAVGSEYMVLEKSYREYCAAGEEAVRAKTSASGSIYFPQDLSDRERSQSISLHVQGQEFCIGPMAHYSWWHGERSLLDCDRGPWADASDIFIAVVERELQWTEKFAKPRRHYERLYRELHRFQKMSPEPHVHALKKYLEVAKCLGYPPGSPFSRPVLRHPDLQPNNILISDSLGIVGLIDWQHATIVPLCLAAGIPKYFENYGDPESDRMVKPARDLPPDFETLNPEEQMVVKSLHVKRLTHFLYAALTLRHNEEHYNAIFDSGVILHQRLYKHAGTPWEGDSITLQAELINAVQDWQDIVSSGSSKCKSPPIHFSEDTIRCVMDMHSQQQEMDAMMDEMRDSLGIDVYGWAPNEDFECTKKLVQSIKERMIESADLREKEGIKNNFPFDDFDEDN